MDLFGSSEGLNDSFDDAGDKFSGFVEGIKKNPLPVILVIVIAALIVYIIISSISAPKEPEEVSPVVINGSGVAGTITVLRNGEVVSQVDLNGDILELAPDANRNLNASISVAGRRNLIPRSVTLTSGNRRTVVTIDPARTVIDDEGNIHYHFDSNSGAGSGEIIVDPDTGTTTVVIDPNSGGMIQCDEGTVLENGSCVITADIDFTDSDTGDGIVITIPFIPVVGTVHIDAEVTQGCLTMSTGLVNELPSTGVVKSEIRLRKVCPGAVDVNASVEWMNERMGNVEVVLNNPSELLTPLPKKVAQFSSGDTITAKVNFVPFKEFEGKVANFRVNFSTGGQNSLVAFVIPIENLEQCIKVTPQQVIVAKGQNSANFEIDVSSCGQNSIDFVLCDGDNSCSGGVEGGIALSSRAFTLNSSTNPKRTVSVTRGIIPGAYGIPIKASVSGSKKIYLGEVLAIIERAGTETLYPDKYVISLLPNSKDSIRITNTNLIEEVNISTSVCSLYQNSLGRGGRSWWKQLSGNLKTLAGEGLYEEALSYELGTLDRVTEQMRAMSTQKNQLIKDAWVAFDRQKVKDKVCEAQSTAFDAFKDVNKLQYLVWEAGAVDHTCREQGLNLEDDACNEEEKIDYLASLVASKITDINKIVPEMKAELDDQKTQITNLSIQKCESAAGLSSKKTAAVTAITTAKTKLNEYANKVNAARTTMVDFNKKHDETDEFFDAFDANVQEVMDRIQLAQDLLSQADEKVNLAIADYDSALAAAAIDATYLASSDDASAAMYLEQAIIDLQDANALIYEAIDEEVAANDILKSFKPKIAEQYARITAMISLIDKLKEQMQEAKTIAQQIKTNIETAKSDINGIIAPAQKACDERDPSTDNDNNAETPENSGCCEIATNAQAIVDSMSTGFVEEQMTAIDEMIPKIDLLKTAVKLYETKTKAYGEQLPKTQATVQKAVDALKVMTDNNVFQPPMDTLQPAIDAAYWLSDKEASSSSASEYPSGSMTFNGITIDNKIMLGLFGTAVSSGFIQGAYDGTVYTTYYDTNEPEVVDEEVPVDEVDPFAEEPVVDDTFDDEWVDTPEEEVFECSEAPASEMLEDCDNQVGLLLPDFKVNLLNATSNVTVSNPAVRAEITTTDAKVFGVFDSQEVGVAFTNSGLSQNTYATVTLNAQEAIHDDPVVVDAAFGPFNVPDASTQAVSYKYHFKFNAAPRKAAIFAPKVSDCQSGILRGTNTESGLAKNVLTWNWADVALLDNSTDTLGDKYFDATQLSILINARLQRLNNLLSTNTFRCPSNPARAELTSVIPSFTGEELEEAGQTGLTLGTPACYLPYTTREFDGKPSLYYFLLSNPTVANNLVNLVDFKANLSRDGYGTAFQNEFTNFYRTQTVASNPSFLDAQTGTSKYFSNNTLAYFSSEGAKYAKSSTFVLPDAGEYRVRMKINFNSQPALFTSGNPASKITFDLYSTNPIYSNYSPFYYTPLDGQVGLLTGQTAEGYRAKLSDAKSIVVNSAQGAILNNIPSQALVSISPIVAEQLDQLNTNVLLRGKIFSLSNATLTSGTALLLSPNLYYAQSMATPIILGTPKTATPHSARYIIKNDITTLAYPSSDFTVFRALNDTDSTRTSLATLSKIPDKKLISNIYSIDLPTTNEPNEWKLGTVIYTLSGRPYYVSGMNQTKVYSPGNRLGTDPLVSLYGVPGMRYNDATTTQLNSLSLIYDAVKQGSACISRNAGEDIIYWPEDKILATLPLN